jgi:hypothetical protein
MTTPIGVGTIGETPVEISLGLCPLAPALFGANKRPIATCLRAVGWARFIVRIHASVAWQSRL